MFDSETFGRFAAAAALALALAALLRPEVERQLRRRLLRLDVEPIRKVEIGFSDWGPTIGLAASFHGHGEDQFVVDASLTVKRDGDADGHRLSWAAFLPARLGANIGEATAPGAFAVSRVEPRQVNILFQDLATQRRFADGMRTLRRRFADFMAFQRLRPEIMSQHDLGREVAIFRRSTHYDADAANAAGSVFYWEPGDYSLLLTIRTATAPHTYDYRFGLSAEESAELRDNVGRMEDVCLGLTSRGPVTISVTLDKIA